MRFEEHVFTRRLPYSEPDILHSVAQQLQNGTIINVVPLKKYLYHSGIEIQVRPVIGNDDSRLTFYKLTNDERRQLVRRLDQWISTGESLPAGNAN